MSSVQQCQMAPPENHMQSSTEPVRGGSSSNSAPHLNDNESRALTASLPSPSTRLHHGNMQGQSETQQHVANSLSPTFSGDTSTSTPRFSNISSHQQHSSFSSSLSPQHLDSLSPRPLGPVPSYSPPSYAFSQQQHHDPSTLDFPDAPTTELAPLQPNAHEHSIGSLPSLASLTSGATGGSTTHNPPPRRFGAPSSGPRHNSYSPPLPPNIQGWPTGNPYSAYYGGGYGYSADSPARMDTDSMSTGTRGPLSPDTIGGGGGRASSVSLDDPDVRMAAEALGDLKADISSPRHQATPLPTSARNEFGTSRTPQQEPLLSLVLESGSVLARPIGGTVSAYNTTKNASPGFIKVPVEYVETVVGSGLQRTGIEGGVRWFFRAKERTRHHQPSGDLEAAESSKKRRKVDSSRSGSASTHPTDMEPYSLSTDQDRRLSMSTVDTLPAYDDARSPEYSEDTTMVDSNAQANSTGSRQSPTPAAWQSRLIMSTSGLSIAMSEESLRSLKYCLSWLKWANDRIARAINVLKETLERYDRQPLATPDASPTTDPDQARRELGARIAALKKDVLQTLQDVIGTVSKYAGGALPQNAREVVKRQLTSLPHRFRLAAAQESSAAAASASSPGPASSSSSSGPDSEDQKVREGAQRVLVIAVEGLEMMGQVSSVLKGTIESAEGWCDTFGRRRRDDAQAQEGGASTQQDNTVTVPFEGVGVFEDARMEQ